MWHKAVVRSGLGALALSLVFPGCTTFSDCKYEVSQRIRTSRAWHEFDGCNSESFTCDYSSGWKAGYYDVITGGDGRPPVVAPKKYWQPPVFFEHDPRGRDEWYTGFQDGARCARCEPDHHFVPTFMPDCHPTSFSGSTVVSGYPLEYSTPQAVPGSSVDEAPAGSAGPRNGSGASETPGSSPPPTGMPPGGPSPMGVKPQRDYETDPPTTTSNWEVSSEDVSRAFARLDSRQDKSLVRQLVVNASQEDASTSTGHSSP